MRDEAAIRSRLLHPSSLRPHPYQSGWLDSNQRPRASEARALPKLSYTLYSSHFGGRTRTCNRSVNSRVLYPFSYPEKLKKRFTTSTGRRDLCPAAGVPFRVVQ